jgi:anti-sigma28 factor (negative regulator of flagellin synthesis)
MSLRIQNDPSGGISSSGVGRPGQLSTGTTSGSGRSGNVSEGGDQVDVSSVAESISSGISEQSQTQAARVAQLSSLYSSGRYVVDSARVSSALVSSAITGSTAGEA